MESAPGLLTQANGVDELGKCDDCHRDFSSSSTDMIDTWYKRCLAEPTVDVMSESCEADICIVGAGLAGLTSALQLARSGLQVVVLEAEQIAWGASGRNGGFVTPGFAQGYAAVEARVGQTAAQALHGLSIEGMQIVADNIRQLQIEDAQPVPGILGICRYPAAGELKSRRDWLAKHFDYHVDHLAGDELSEHLKSACYHDALHDQNAFHFNPLAYARGLAAAIRKLGGRIHEKTAVETINGSQGSWKVVTSRGTVAARDVLLTTGGYTGKLQPALHRSYLPIATYVMLTENNPELIASVISTRSAILDDRRASDYYRVVDEGRRLLWGGRITTRVSEPRALSVLLHRSMVATYPQLAQLKVDTAWSGSMSYARHRMPQIGQLPNGQWYCTAFGGHGMNTTAIGGHVIAEAITGQSDRYRQFSPFGLEYTGGVVGRAAVQATYWGYQLMDKWQERARGG
ncbi:NAD(P)/FAD-dependent oxidoreductase [Granulosicoccus antarcticus]|uniref:Gamma-glutamylputrescine oxidoreductase n=1 Tax=Granulosicoccus antarcticus IMCC3135 TaxID=1192854 RepID=A0A2Z2P3U9_9GAMM|nr:FAD-binding oxidoreductase [Granulosicoccus antarcticus]ASJ76080.1 Gamma-glutamylputrescine oxidoreductase [Granulosicoccus antarcticus IMCC3135]